MAQGATLLVDAVYTMTPCAYVDIAIPVFGKALDIGKGELAFFSICLYHLSVAFVKVLEFLAFSDVSYQYVVVSHPYISVAGGEKWKHTLS